MNKVMPLNILLFVFLLVCIFYGTKPVYGSQEGNDTINTDNYANKKLNYYYYIPDSVLDNPKKTVHVMVIVPGLNGRGSDFAQPFKNVAQELRMIIVAPSFQFDENNFQSQSSYQFPSAWSGQALLDILQKVRKKNKLSTGELYMFGHSAGAQFVLRFSLLHPDMVRAVAASGNGGYITVDKYVKVKYYYMMGKYDTQRTANAQAFCKSAVDKKVAIYYKEYEAGHELTNQQFSDTFEFFRQVKNGKL